MGIIEWHFHVHLHNHSHTILFFLSLNTSPSNLSLSSLTPRSSQLPTYSTSPHLNIPHPNPPSPIPQIISPFSSAPAPHATTTGQKWSKVGCANLASGLLTKSAIRSSLPTISLSTASRSALSKETLYADGCLVFGEKGRSLRLCTLMPEAKIRMFCERRELSAWPNA